MYTSRKRRPEFEARGTTEGIIPIELNEVHKLPELAETQKKLQGYTDTGLVSMFILDNY